MRDNVLTFKTALVIARSHANPRSLTRDTGGAHRFVTVAPLYTRGTQYIDAKSSTRTRGYLSPSLVFELNHLALPPQTRKIAGGAHPERPFRGSRISRNCYVGNGRPYDDACKLGAFQTAEQPCPNVRSVPRTPPKRTRRQAKSSPPTTILARVTTTSPQRTTSTQPSVLTPMGASRPAPNDPPRRHGRPRT